MDTDETQPLEQPSFFEACKGPVDPTSKQLHFEEVNVDDATVGGIKKGDSKEALGSTEEVAPKSVQKRLSDPGDFSGLASNGEKYQPPELPLKPVCMVKNCTEPISPEQQLHSVRVCESADHPEDEEDQKIKKAEEKKRQKKAKAKAKAKAKGRPAKSKAAAKPKAAKKDGNGSDSCDSDGQKEEKKTKPKKKIQPKKKKPEVAEGPAKKKKTREDCDGEDAPKEPSVTRRGSKKRTERQGTKRPLPLTEGVDAELETKTKTKTKTKKVTEKKNRKQKKAEIKTEPKEESEAEKIAREKKAKLSRKSAAYHRAKREAKLAGDDDSTILEKAKAVSC